MSRLLASQRQTLGAGAVGSLLIAALVVVAAFIVLFPWFPGGLRLEVGSTVERAIVAPRDESYDSDLLTEQVREAAAAAVVAEPVFDSGVRDRQLDELDRILNAIDVARANRVLSASARESTIRAVPEPPLSARSAVALASASVERWEVVAGEGRSALGRTLTGAISEDGVGEGRLLLAGYLSPSLSGEEALALSELIGPLVVPTLVVDDARTEQLREQARAAVPVVHASFTRGEVIVPAGTVLTAADVEALERLGIRVTGVRAGDVAGTALMALLIGAALGGYVRVSRAASLRSARRQLLFAVLLLAPAAVAKFALPVILPDFDRQFLALALPLAAGPIAAAVLIDVSAAVLLTLLLTAIVAFVTIFLPGTDQGIVAAQLETARLALATVAGSLAGIYVAANADRLQRFLAAGVASAGATAAAAILVWLAGTDRGAQDLLWIAGAASVGGVLVALLSVGAFVLLSRPFGIITRVELMEQAQLSQPLLRRLQDEAPGTFQHSILVGNLAERAADRIGANSLLVRVGAYYHDIGKLVGPSFFAENFGEGENPHEGLDPLQSTRVIQQHVTGGAELGRREGLPDAVVQFIPQHHGTRLVTFFYRQAAQDDPDVDPELFRYGGPKPQSRETALVMLADSCEATARASTDHSREAIELIVEATIRERIEEGQLDECDLSLRDLRIVAESYSSALAAVFHPRVEYPEPTARELEQRGIRRDGDGGGARPAARTGERSDGAPEEREWSIDPPARPAPARGAGSPPPAPDADPDAELGEDDS